MKECTDSFVIFNQLFSNNVVLQGRRAAEKTRIFAEISSSAWKFANIVLK